MTCCALLRRSGPGTRGTAVAAPRTGSVRGRSAADRVLASSTPATWVCFKLVVVKPCVCGLGFKEVQRIRRVILYMCISSQHVRHLEHQHILYEMCNSTYSFAI